MTTDALPARERILLAALELLDEGGAEAVSTRAVTARAQVQAPAIYRLFGDKDGLLDAAVERVYADWVAAKSSRALPEDPVEAIRVGWDDAVQFGLDHPAAYRIVQARAEPGPAIALGVALLQEKVALVARAGRLRETPERACALLQAVGRGVTLSLLDTPPGQRDPRMAAAAREAVIAAVTTEAPLGDRVTLSSTAVALRALLPGADALLPAERQLMELWLERIATG
ncbi:TetR/AcrR family transcriptional regulator [Rathayibacter oskolensis]|uniref:TetR/AcrR family transcriptional regulator n=1 Tax=Rathayibacter oskolensis TaxID=1891671 RepID=UPI00265E798C|nr:TetR/AcrR family transcriptional regulator [Rathayibacter oskolensis]WKK72172.1 TetR/AcrR family transcriptional regulator [Rathayibacter oskolensis]